MSSITYETTSPTDTNVRNILREKFGTNCDSIIEEAMDSVGRRYGSWRGFYTFTLSKLSDFITRKKIDKE